MKVRTTTILTVWLAAGASCGDVGSDSVVGTDEPWYETDPEDTSDTGAPITPTSENTADTSSEQ